MNDTLFPKIKQSIADFLFEEEGSITRNNVLAVGSMMLIMGLLLSIDAFAKHSSHKSHTSHKSHSSGSYHRSHSSHSSAKHNISKHTSHSSHSSATPTLKPSHTNIPLPDLSNKTIGAMNSTETFSISGTVTPTISLPDTPKIR